MPKFQLPKLKFLESTTFSQVSMTLLVSALPRMFFSAFSGLQNSIHSSGPNLNLSSVKPSPNSTPLFYLSHTRLPFFSSRKFCYKHTHHMQSSSMQLPVSPLTAETEFIHLYFWSTYQILGKYLVNAEYICNKTHLSYKIMASFCASCPSYWPFLAASWHWKLSAANQNCKIFTASSFSMY